MRTGLLDARDVVVTDDGAGVATALAKRLTARGIPSRVAAVPEKCDAVIFLGGLRDVADVDAALAVEREAFRAARAVATGRGKTGGVFVTVQDTGGDFGITGGDAVRAWLGGLAGLAKTAAQEWSGAHVRAIDVARAAAVTRRPSRRRSPTSSPRAGPSSKRACARTVRAWCSRASRRR